MTATEPLWLIERRLARHNCATMAVLIEEHGGKDIDVFEIPEGGGCNVQFVTGDAKKYGDWEYCDLTVVDDDPEVVAIGKTYPSVLKSLVPAKTDELYELGCEGRPRADLPPNAVEMVNCPIKNKKQMEALARALV